MYEYIITANGPDKTGIVSELSKIITESGGNIQESRMTKLAGDFAIIMLIVSDLPQTEIEHSLSKLPLSFSIKKPTKTHSNSENKIIKKIQLNGADNEGLVYSLTDFLSKNKINIQNLNTEITQAPITGINLFRMEAIINIPKNISIDILINKINKLQNKLEVDIELINI